VRPQIIAVASDLDGLEGAAGLNLAWHKADWKLQLNHGLKLSVKVIKVEDTET
jgi:hypothetical protein